MARVARNTIPAECRLFNLLVQGVEGFSVFNEHRFKSYYMRELKSRGEGVVLLAFTILENHAHLLYYAPSIGAVTALMKRVNTSFALYYNKCKFRSGYVFNGRFKCQCVNNLSDATDCAEYIHNNCMREGSQFTPKTYPYSSFKQLQTLRPDIGAILKQNGIEYESNTPPDPDIVWLDTAVIVPHSYENFNTVLKELISRYKISDSSQFLENREMLGRFVLELKTRTGATNLSIAAELAINRETLRKAVVNVKKG